MDGDTTLRNTIYIGLGLLGVWALYAWSTRKTRPATASTYRKLPQTYEVEGFTARPIGPEAEYDYPEREHKYARREREYVKRERGTPIRPPNIPIYAYEHGKIRKLAPTAIKMIVPTNPLAEYCMESHGDIYASDGKILLIDRSPREVADWNSDLEVKGELTREKVKEVWPKNTRYYIPVPFPGYIDAVYAIPTYIYLAAGYPFGLNSRYVNWLDKEGYVLFYNYAEKDKPLILKRRGKGEAVGLLMPITLENNELYDNLKKQRLI